jgi:exosome complex component RRP45
VSGEIVAPYLDRPTEGFYSFNIDFSPMADPSLEMARGFLVEVGRVVERGLRESRAIDTEALCIVAGQKVKNILRCEC